MNQISHLFFMYVTKREYLNATKEKKARQQRGEMGRKDMVGEQKSAQELILKQIWTEKKFVRKINSVNYGTLEKQTFYLLQQF